MKSRHNPELSLLELVQNQSPHALHNLGIFSAAHWFNSICKIMNLRTIQKQLLENNLQLTSTGGQIQIKAYHRAPKVVILVSDTKWVNILSFLIRSKYLSLPWCLNPAAIY